MKNNLTLNDILTDIMCTEKSYYQEIQNKQFTMIIRGNYTKTDLEKSLIRLMPDLKIEKIGSSALLKKQYSLKSAKKGGYYYQLGSNRSSAKGSKKFFVKISNPEIIVKYLTIKE